MSLVRGATMVEKFGMKRRYQDAIPTNCRTFRTVVGTGHSATALIFEFVDAVASHHVPEILQF